LTSVERRIGNNLFQVFYLRGRPKHETFRVEIGFYDEGQLVSDWTYGVVFEKDINRDSVRDYVWYGGDDTGQRLLWFISKEDHFECTDIFKSAEAAWGKKFGKAAPDLGEVGGNEMVDDVIWDRKAQLLSVSVVPNDLEEMKTHRVKLVISPTEFESCKR